MAASFPLPLEDSIHPSSLIFFESHPSEGKTEDERTPFYIVCEKGHIEIVKLLLNDSKVGLVDINKAEKHGATPYWAACYYGHQEIVELLINDQRVDINKANQYNQSPFFIACQNGHQEIVKSLLSDKIVAFIEVVQNKLRVIGNTFN